MNRVEELFKPYTLDQFIADGQPQDHKDVERLEKIWVDYQNKRLFNTCYSTIIAVSQGRGKSHKLRLEGSNPSTATNMALQHYVS